MKRLILIACFALIMSGTSWAYKYSVDSIPVALRENAEAVVRSDQMVYTVESTGKAKINFKRVITLMNENAEFLRVVRIYYDKFSSVQNIKASVYDANGKFIESIPSSKIMDISMGGGFVSDARMKRIIFPVNRYPFTIEVEYNVTENGLMNLPQWNFHLSPSLSVEESAVQFVIPHSIPFRYREYNMQSSVDSVEIDGTTIYTWVERNIPAIKQWYFSPLSYARRPVLLSAIEDFMFGGIKGSMQTWESFGLWQAELNSGLDQLDEAEKKHIADLTAGLSDDREKAKVLYTYMQSRTRYASIQLGIGGYKPAPAVSVSEKGFGDCKGLTNYMHALLKEAGIASFYTLVKSGANKNIISSFVSDQFDHIILCVPMKGDTVWLECTSQTIPFGFLGTFTSDREVLLVTQEGGRIAHTPAFSNSYYKTTGTIDIARRDFSRGSLKVTSGGSGYDANRVYARKDATELTRMLNSDLALGTFVIDSAAYNEFRDGDPVSALSYTVRVKDLSVTAGNRIHFRPCLEPFDYQPFDTVGVKIYDIPASIDSITYIIPAGYIPEFLPESVSKEGQCGIYRYEIKALDENSLLFTREFRVNKGIYQGDRARELFAFLNSAAEKDHQRLILVRSRN